VRCVEQQLRRVDLRLLLLTHQTAAAAAAAAAAAGVHSLTVLN
jgi:hypothetical protein